MMRKSALSIVLLCALMLTAFDTDKNWKLNYKAVSKLKEEGFNKSKVMETLFEMTDVNGPRLTGSSGMRRAERWAKNKLEDWGLSNVEIESWGGFGKGWENHKTYLAMNAPYYQSLIAAPKAWTPSTNGLIKANAVLLRIDSIGDLAKYKGKLKGKIVVYSQTNAYDLKINFNADARRLTEEELKKSSIDNHLDEISSNPNPNVKPASGRPVNKIRPVLDSFLLAEGALAVLSGGNGSVGTLFTSNGASRAWDAKPILPEMELGAEHLHRLVRLLDAGKEIGLEMEMDNTYLMADSTESNVIAELPGTDLKDEVIILGAHMDSWHAATGTTDNATGSAVVMEAIRLIKACNLHPRRTIRLVLWSGEEQGLLGSRGYVKKHFGDRLTMKLKPDQQKVSCYFNLDNGAGKIRGIYAQGNYEAAPIFKNWFEPFKDLGAETVNIRNTGSTDHISFDEIGIPGFQFMQDPLEYGTRSHHTNMDSYERVNANDLMQASIVMASFIYHAAMANDKLPRKALPKPVGK